MEVLVASWRQGGLPGGVLCPKLWSLVFLPRSSLLQMLEAQTIASPQQIGRYPRSALFLPHRLFRAGRRQTWDLVGKCKSRSQCELSSKTYRGRELPVTAGVQQRLEGPGWHRRGTTHELKVGVSGRQASESRARGLRFQLCSSPLCDLGLVSFLTFAKSPSPHM